MVQKYPHIFKDHDDDGVPIGDGSASIFCKLYERASYLRRHHKRKNSSPSVSPQLAKKKANMMAGCSNWAPSFDNPAVTKSDKDKLQTLSENNKEEFGRLMEATYSEQKKFFKNVDSPPTVEMIKEVIFVYVIFNL